MAGRRQLILLVLPIFILQYCANGVCKSQQEADPIPQLCVDYFTRTIPASGNNMERFGQVSASGFIETQCMTYLSCLKDCNIGPCNCKSFVDDPETCLTWQYYHSLNADSYSMDIEVKVFCERPNDTPELVELVTILSEDLCDLDFNWPATPAACYESDKKCRFQICETPDCERNKLGISVDLLKVPRYVAAIAYYFENSDIICPLQYSRFIYHAITMRINSKTGGENGLTFSDDAVLGTMIDSVDYDILRNVTTDIRSRVERDIYIDMEFDHIAPTTLIVKCRAPQMTNYKLHSFDVSTGKNDWKIIWQPTYTLHNFCNNFVVSRKFDERIDFVCKKVDMYDIFELHIHYPIALDFEPYTCNVVYDTVFGSTSYKNVAFKVTEEPKQYEFNLDHYYVPELVLATSKKGHTPPTVESTFYQLQVYLPTQMKSAYDALREPSHNVDEYTTKLMEPITFCIDDKCSSGDMFNRTMTFYHPRQHKQVSRYGDFIESNGCDLAVVPYTNFIDMNLNRMDLSQCVSEELEVIMTPQDMEYYKIFGHMDTCFGRSPLTNLRYFPRKSPPVSLWFNEESVIIQSVNTIISTNVYSVPHFNIPSGTIYADANFMKYQSRYMLFGLAHYYKLEIIDFLLIDEDYPINVLSLRTLRQRHSSHDYSIQELNQPAAVMRTQPNDEMGTSGVIDPTTPSVPMPYYGPRNSPPFFPGDRGNVNHERMRRSSEINDENDDKYYGLLLYAQKRCFKPEQLESAITIPLEFRDMFDIDYSSTLDFGPYFFYIARTHPLASSTTPFELLSPDCHGQHMFVFKHRVSNNGLSGIVDTNRRSYQRQNKGRMMFLPPRYPTVENVLTLLPGADHLATHPVTGLTQPEVVGNKTGLNVFTVDVKDIQREIDLSVPLVVPPEYVKFSPFHGLETMKATLPGVPFVPPILKDGTTYNPGYTMDDIAMDDQYFLAGAMDLQINLDNLTDVPLHILHAAIRSEVGGVVSVPKTLLYMLTKANCQLNVPRVLKVLPQIEITVNWYSRTSFHVLCHSQIYSPCHEEEYVVNSRGDTEQMYQMVVEYFLHNESNIVKREVYNPKNLITISQEYHQFDYIGCRMLNGTANINQASSVDAHLRSDLIDVTTMQYVDSHCPEDGYDLTDLVIHQCDTHRCNVSCFVQYSHGDCVPPIVNLFVDPQNKHTCHQGIDEPGCVHYNIAREVKMTMLGVPAGKEVTCEIKTNENNAIQHMRIDVEVNADICSQSNIKYELKTLKSRHIVLKNVNANFCKVPVIDKVKVSVYYTTYHNHDVIFREDIFINNIQKGSLACFGEMSCTYVNSDPSIIVLLGNLESLYKYLHSKSAVSANMFAEIDGFMMKYLSLDNILWPLTNALLTPETLHIPASPVHVESTEYVPQPAHWTYFGFPIVILLMFVAILILVLYKTKTIQSVWKFTKRSTPKDVEKLVSN